MRVTPKKAIVLGSEGFQNLIGVDKVILNFDSVDFVRFTFGAEPSSTVADYLLLDITDYVKTSIDENMTQVITNLNTQVDNILKDFSGKQVILCQVKFDRGTGSWKSIDRLNELYFFMAQKVKNIRKIKIKNITGDLTKWTFSQEIVASFCDQLESILKFDAEIEISNYKTIVKVSGNTLHAEIRLDDSFPQVSGPIMYKYMIIKDSKVLFKTEPLETNSFEYELKEDGIYFVQGYVHVNGISTFNRSNVVEYFTPDLISRYEDYLKEGVTDEPDLWIHESPESFQDFVVIISKDNLTQVARAIKEHGLKELHKGSAGEESIYIFGKSALDVEKNRKIIFSGFIKQGQRINIGEKELEAVPVGELDNSFGCFSFVDINKKGIVSISSDFCSYSRIFYYKGSDGIVISNHYSLLLSVAKIMKYDISFDYEKALMTLASGIHQFSLQNFSRKMDVKNVLQLPPYHRIKIDQKGMKIEKNEVHNILSSERILSRHEYESLLDQAVSEIEENAAAVLHDDRFSCTYCDLTGGLDSRIVFASVTSLPEYKDKVVINTRGQEENVDVILALKINSMFNFRFADDRDLRFAEDFTISDNFTRDQNLGTIYSHKINPYRLLREKCTLSGGTGDAFARPLYSRHHFGKKGEYCSTVQEFSQHFESTLSPHIIADSKRTMCVFQKTLNEEMKETPVSSILEKFDKLYFSYRSSYHFDPLVDYSTGYLIWMPLQSRTLFELNHLTHDAFRGIKLQLDVIKRINPLFLHIPFADDLDTNEYLSMKDELVPSNSSLEMINIKTEDISEQWREANRRRAAKTIGTHFEKDGNMDSAMKDKLHNKLKIILKVNNGFFSKKMGIALFYHITERLDSQYKSVVIYNKISSILDQIKLLSKSERIPSMNENAVRMSKRVQCDRELELARMYKEGDTLEQDTQLAIETMRRALGENRLRTDYIDLLLESQLPDDHAEAILLLMTLVNNGDYNSMMKLSRMYRDGKCVKQDTPLATEIMRRALGENKVRLEYLDLLLKSQSREDHAEALPIAIALTEKGDYNGMIRLARMYRDGKGTEQNIPLAIELMSSVFEKSDIIKANKWLSRDYVSLLFESSNKDDLKAAIEVCEQNLQEINGWFETTAEKINEKMDKL